VNVALVVLGDIAPKTAADDAPLNPIFPNCVKLQPLAVNETPVAPVVLAQPTATTTDSLAAFAEAVNVNVDAEEVPPCCTNIFVCEILAQPEEPASSKAIMTLPIIAVAEKKRFLRRAHSGRVDSPV
jgi:hypothetical protein